MGDGGLGMGDGGLRPEGERVDAITCLSLG